MGLGEAQAAGEAWPGPAAAGVWVPAGEPVDADLGDGLGEDTDAAIEGRTSEDHFQPFFNEKTFGAGEAGKARGSRRAAGRQGRGGPPLLTVPLAP